MKNVLSPKEQALAAVDAVIKSPYAPTGWTMAEMVSEIWGGPKSCMGCVSETRDALIELTALAKKHDYTNVAGKDMLINLKILFDCLLDSRQNQAEVQRWAIEANDDEDNYDPFLTDEHFLNIAKRYVLLLELDRLDAENRNLRLAIQDSQKEAA